MSGPFVGEIRMFGGNFNPNGWMFCNGQLLPISEYETLFNLIGTTYGGDGQETFALPNLQSRIPIHVGPGFVQGQTGGVESVTLTVNQIPAHNHIVQANSAVGTANTPANNVLSSQNVNQAPPLYIDTKTNSTTLSPAELGSAGGSQPHDNMIPFLCISFIISLFGVFPSQT